MKITGEDKLQAKTIMNRFKEPKTDEEVFYELLFCICAPQTTFKNNIKVNDDLKRLDYYNWDCSVLHDVLKPVRFFNNKAKWVREAKQKFPAILTLLSPLKHEDYFDKSNASILARTWLVKNIKGLGMKTASHFLRNLGAENLAIIDRHILKYFKATGKWKYEELENLFRHEAKKENLTVAELDIIVWKYYSGTTWSDFTH